MANIFVIEDDENIRNLIKMALEGNGYEVDAFETAEEALELIEEKTPALAIFDLMLPGIDGLEAIRRIRRMSKVKDMLLLILTAKDKEYDKVVGLDCGADDYMTKPFGIMELSARIRSLLRRMPKKEEHPQMLSVNGIEIDTGAREVWVAGQNIDLTYREFELLMYLYNNNQKVVSRDELLDKLWGYECDVETRTVDIHIGTLRKKLGDEGAESIKTIRNVGYRFVSFDK
ncbi:MAG TPA: response regulator transcription factor [Lachnospiraceae bacterium]|jgi:two-component system, OmpR family, alkaline phosphatase synthesis response regulator PhoP|nr:response regulator transcription factor [Lachnospiraceae bacterium]